MARAEVVRLVLQDSGIDPERFTLEWVSSAEAPRFAEVIRKFTGKIRSLGPNPSKEHQKEAAIG